MKGLKPLVVTVIVLCGIFVTGIVTAQVTTIIGKVKSIDLETKTVVVSTFDGDDVAISVEDESSLNKLRHGLIKVGDDIKVKYEVKGGKNVPTYFRKVMGC